MGFRDYFNDNDDDENDLAEELAKEEEEYYDEIDFDWKGKKYTSVKQLRRELSLGDLKIVINNYDKNIIKSEKKLKRHKVTGVSFVVLFLAGLGLSFLQPSGLLKNFIDIFSKASMVVGVAGSFLKSKHCCDEDEKNDKLFYVFEELDEEIMLREGEAAFQKNTDELFEL